MEQGPQRLVGVAFVEMVGDLGGDLDRNQSIFRFPRINDFLAFDVANAG